MPETWLFRASLLALPGASSYTHSVSIGATNFSEDSGGGPSYSLCAYAGAHRGGHSLDLKILGFIGQLY